MKTLCAWRGIGLGIPNPIEWTKGMEEMLPAEARSLLAEATPADKGPEVRKDLDRESEPPTTVKPSEPNWLKRAKAAFAKNQFEETIKILSNSNSAAKESLKALRIWSLALSRIGRPDDAVQIAREATTRFPNDPNAHEIVAHALSWNRQREEATEEYRQALELGAKPTMKRFMGVELYLADRPEDAEPLFREALGDAKDHAERSSALSWLGMALEKLGRHAEAIANFQEAETLAPLHYADYLSWSNALTALGQKEEAEEKHKKFIELRDAEQKGKQKVSP